MFVIYNKIKAITSWKNYNYRKANLILIKIEGDMW
jgi:hypothetical protein